MSTVAATLRFTAVGLTRWYGIYLTYGENGSIRHYYSQYDHVSTVAATLRFTAVGLTRWYGIYPTYGGNGSIKH